MEYAAPVAAAMSVPPPGARKAHCNCVTDCGGIVLVVVEVVLQLAYVGDCVGVCQLSYCFAPAVVVVDDVVDDGVVSAPAVAAGVAASCAAASRARTFPAESAAVAAAADLATC